MGLAVHMISKEPLILHGYDWQCGVSPFLELAPALYKKPAHFLISLSWTLLERQRLIALLEGYRQHRKVLPHHQFTILTNMPEEKKLLDHCKVPAVICPHNALLDEACYPLQTAEKKYTAVINARMTRFKRIHLARDVPRTCLITYRALQHEVDYERELQATMPHMHWLQYENGTFTHYFSAKQVADVYAISGCGLILSDVEGGCFASTEYLLCGLPVVTTDSVGGRDLFFHDDYVVRCLPNKDAVTRAVEKALVCPVPPEEMRERTVHIMRRYRKNYIALLNNIARREGDTRDFEDEWPLFFKNKMITWYADKHAAFRAFREAGICDDVFEVPD